MASGTARTLTWLTIPTFLVLGLLALAMNKAHPHSPTTSTGVPIPSVPSVLRQDTELFDSIASENFSPITSLSAFTGAVLKSGNLNILVEDVVWGLTENARLIPAYLRGLRDDGIHFELHQEIGCATLLESVEEMSGFWVNEEGGDKTWIERTIWGKNQEGLLVYYPITGVDTNGRCFDIDAANIGGLCPTLIDYDCIWNGAMDGCPALCAGQCGGGPPPNPCECLDGAGYPTCDPSCVWGVAGSYCDDLQHSCPAGKVCRSPTPCACR